MARAEVQITAVDKTANAIRSATNGLKTVERTAKVTGKAINLAFGFFTGAALTAAFGKILEAAKKTNEGAQAIDRLNKALKDPALVSAANSFTSALAGGFARVVEFAAKAAKEVTKVGREIGLLAEASTKPQSAGSMGSRFGRVYKPNLSEEQLTMAYSAILRERLSTKGPAEDAVKKSPQESLATYIKNLRTAQNAERAKALADWQADLLRETDQVLKKVADNAADDVVGQVMKSNERQFGEKITRMSIFAEEAARAMQSSFAEFLFDPFENGLKGMLSGFIGVIRRMLAELAAQQLLTSFFGAFAGGSGIVGQFASAALAGLQPRAKGGPVTGSTPYLVGERGPEMFIPGTGGTIVPNGGGMGGGVSVNYQIDARGATMDLAQALPGILADNNRRIFDELDRRHGIR
jgi:hypothetical protein